jgi:hypothetical protein
LALVQIYRTATQGGFYHDGGISFALV